MSIKMEVEGCEELERDLRTAIHKFPDTAERELKKNANALKRAARENMNSKIKHHRDNLIDQSWRTKQVEEGVSATIMVFNKAPHSHLVEIGHEEYDFHGNPTGRWVEGNHALEETTGEFEKEMIERYEKMIENLLGGNNL